MRKCCVSKIAICSGYLKAIFALALPATASFANTIQVPAQQATIQAAINGAVNGDTITVAPGTYHENLDFKGKAIKLIGTNGAGSTIIDGGTSNYVITFQTSETTASVVSGFTIQNGVGSFANSVYALGSSPTLEDNVFLGSAGVSIYGFSSSMVLQRNLFAGWTCPGGPEIAIVAFVNSSSPSIKDNVFANNHCPALDMTLPTGNAPDVANNTIVNNDVGIQVDARVNASLQLYRNNLIYGNGVGFMVNNGQPGNYATLQNNLVYGNTTNYQGFPDPTGTNGNISADPMLGGLSVPDYHPDAGSPAIDAGLNAAVGAGETDFYGVQRIRVGTSGSSIVDIGAVEYVAAQPTVSLSISASSILLGASVTITWSSTNASTCVAGGAWSGTLALSGSQSITPPAGMLTYKVTCTNGGASRAQSAALTVYPPPTVSIAASPSTVISGQVSTLTWSTTNATTCTKAGAWSGSAPTIGSLVVGPTNAGTYTYSLSCTGPDGTTIGSATLTVIPLPQITLTFTPSSIPVGGTSTMTWTSSNTTSCVASGSWSGAEPTSGSQTIGPFPAGLYLYGLTCTGPGGSTSNTQGITVFVPPTATITVTPSSVPSGTAVSLTWSSTNASSCQASGAWSGPISVSGNASFTPTASGSFTYGITCMGPSGGTVSANANLMVYGQPAASLTLSAPTIIAGGTATLTWTSSQTTSCIASGAWTGALEVSGTRSITQSTPGSYTYNLTCTNPVGSVETSAKLTVNAPASSGGGAFGLLDLSLLAIFASLRRRVCDSLGARKGRLDRE